MNKLFNILLDIQIYKEIKYMITNASEFNKIQIESFIEDYNNNMPINIPVKLDKVNDDLTINCNSLIDDRVFNNVQILAPIGISYDLNRLKYGILLNVPYYFYEILSNGKISEVIQSKQTQYGLFIPILDNTNKFNKDVDISINSIDNKSNITLKDNVLIQSKTPIEIKTDNSSLYEVLNDLLQLLLKVNNDPVAGNGSPLASPNLAQIPNIISKLNNVLK